MKILKLLTFIAIALSVASCNNSQQNNTDTAQVDSLALINETNQTVEFYGTYEGVTPAAKSQTLKTQLVVNDDQTFILKSEYVGKGDSGRYEENGNYSVINGKVLELTDKNGRKVFYKIQDGSVVLSDPDGNVAEGMGENYVLNKI